MFKTLNKMQKYLNPAPQSGTQLTIGGFMKPKPPDAPLPANKEPRPQQPAPIQTHFKLTPPTKQPPRPYSGSKKKPEQEIQQVEYIPSETKPTTLTQPPRIKSKYILEEASSDEDGDEELDDFLAPEDEEELAEVEREMSKREHKGNKVKKLFALDNDDDSLRGSSSEDSDSSSDSSSDNSSDSSSDSSEDDASTQEKAAANPPEAGELAAVVDKKAAAKEKKKEKKRRYKEKKRRRKEKKRAKERKKKKKRERKRRQREEEEDENHDDTGEVLMDLHDITDGNIDDEEQEEEEEEQVQMKDLFYDMIDLFLYQYLFAEKLRVRTEIGSLLPNVETFTDNIQAYISKLNQQASVSNEVAYLYLIASDKDCVFINTTRKKNPDLDHCQVFGSRYPFSGNNEQYYIKCIIDSKKKALCICRRAATLASSFNFLSNIEEQCKILVAYKLKAYRDVNSRVLHQFIIMEDFKSERYGYHEGLWLLVKRALENIRLITGIDHEFF